MNSISLRLRVVIVLVIAALVGIGAYAFTATNTVAGSNAGVGSGTISGYDVSNVHYALNGTFDKIDSVTFDLNPGNTSVLKVRFTDSGSWFDCPNSASAATRTVTCDVSGAPGPVDLATADNLSVAATS
ncbi:MAG TPA: hypothetical protein VH416_01520 [Gaiellaceae bacterium]|jgi:hypothetical protein